MKKTELKKLIKEAFLTEKKSNLLNENSPGFDNRKQGGALPTLESVKAAYQAKKLKEASAEEEIKSTKELTAAVKDLEGAKKEAGLSEDEGNLKINDFFYKDIKEEMARQENQTLVTKDFLEKVKNADTVEKMRALFEDNDVEEVFDSINDDFIAAGGSRDEALDEADEYDPGALAKVGESTTNGIVVKNTKLANGQVEVEYESGDVQVLEKENGTWIEVSYRKPGIRETIKRADTIIAEYNKLQTKK